MFSKLSKWLSTTLTLLILAFAALASSPAAAQQFVTVDVPGAASTYISQINDNGQMVGGYTDIDGVTHGVLVNAGVFTAIDFPGSTNTQAYGINDSGQIVGIYYDANNALHGFLYVNGTFTTIANPAYVVTLPLGIDDLGDVVGAGVDGQGVNHGFRFSNGVFTNIDFPGATSTQVFGTDLRGDSLTGGYTLPSSPANTLLGFTEINGQFTTVTFPQSVSTIPNDINNGGQVTGSYLLPSDSNFHSFLETGANFAKLDVPGATQTLANGLNDLGQVTGWYLDANNVVHGFLSSTGPFAYVADGAGVSVVDTPTNIIVVNIPVPGGAWDLAITPDQKHVYVTQTGLSTVSVIDTTTDEIVATIPVGTYPYSVTIAPNGNFAYVPNVGNASTPGTVSVIRIADNTVVATVPVGVGPYACAVTPDSTLVYVSNLGDGTISVIDAATNIAATPFPVSAPLGLAFTPAGASAYVTNYTSPGSVTVLAVPSNEITATILLGTPANPVTSPIEIALTPDGTTAYVTDDSSSEVSAINTASNTVTKTLALSPGGRPFRLAVTPDSTNVYVGNYSAATVSVIQTSNNTVKTTIPIPGSYVSGIVIASAPPASKTVTQTLSPTQPNTFNFGTDSQTVQYPPGTKFSNVAMNTVAQQITQAEFQQRVAGGKFANATCIVYGGNGGNCVDYLVTCTNGSGTPITCPSEAQPTIAVETDFTTSQAIVDPGYLTTPIGKNNWTNIFDSFTDPKVKGKTKGFSEFVAVDLGASNPQGLANFTLLNPTKTQTRPAGQGVPMSFKLTSVANGSPVTDAKGNLTVTQIADATGKTVNQVVFSAHNVFTQPGNPGVYFYRFCTDEHGNPKNALPVGTYRAVIYGNAFASHQVKFKLVAP